MNASSHHRLLPSVTERRKREKKKPRERQKETETTVTHIRNFSRYLYRVKRKKMHRTEETEVKRPNASRHTSP